MRKKSPKRTARTEPLSLSSAGVLSRARKKKAKRPGQSAVVAVADDRLDQVHGVPDEEQIEEALGKLESADRDAWQEVRQLLAAHLGSAAAARLWLVTPAPGFTTIPLDEARKPGGARLLLEMLEADWGPYPAYA